MNNTWDENLIDELITQAKNGQLKSANDEFSAVILKISSLPTNKIPQGDLARVRRQILQRLSVPVQATEKKGFNIFSDLPRILRVSGSLVGSFLILLSLAMGTAVAALGSIPGETLYPVKQAFEEAQVKLASNEEDRANLQIKLANKRLEELQDVLEQSDQGKLSEAKKQKIVSETVKSLQKITSAASATSAKTSGDKPRTDILNKIVTLSNKQDLLLKTASIKSEGETKIEITKALEVSKISKETAIENIERAGLVLEEQPLTIEDKIASPDVVMTTGKITQITSTTLSIGTAKFMLTNDTKYANITLEEIAVGQIVDIEATVKDDKTIATKITLVKPEVTKPEPNAETDPNTEKQ